MKTLIAVSAVVFSVALTACSTPPPAPVVVAPPPPWAEPRIANLTAVAEAQGYQVQHEGDVIKLIIPVDGTFHPKRTLLLPSGLAPLGKIAKALKDDNGSQFAVVGHSSSDGDRDLNRRLSMERAQAVASILMLGGVSSRRLSLHTMGEDKPMADNSTPTGRDLNRRVEIRLTPYPARNIALAATQP
ncbi:MAG: OmpA family protein [Pseudomonas sp.]|jgi:outer membrane protein OmpA-like peptidoglycan-associated protein|nr:OmpA family protein [Pseudomonas sp.]